MHGLLVALLSEIAPGSAGVGFRLGLELGDHVGEGIERSVVRRLALTGGAHRNFDTEVTGALHPSRIRTLAAHHLAPISACFKYFEFLYGAMVAIIST